MTFRKEEEDPVLPWPISIEVEIRIWMSQSDRGTLCLHDLFVILIACLIIELYVNKLILWRTT